MFNGGLIQLDFEQYAHLNSIIYADSIFLKNLGLMDYSLLLVIEQSKMDATRKRTTDHSREEKKNT